MSEPRVKKKKARGSMLPIHRAFDSRPACAAHQGQPHHAAYVEISRQLLRAP
jgi:hypothetical protein